MSYGIVALVSAISTAVTTALAAASYPALTDGKILLGRQHQYEGSAPPRIIFTPMSSRWAAKLPASASNIATNAPYSPEGKAQIAQRAILSEYVTFEVSCWGSAGGTSGQTGNPDDDFIVTMALYQAVIQQTHLMSVGSYDVISAGGGKWRQSQPTSTQLNVYGQEFVFGLTLAIPVLDRLLPFAPSGVAPHTGIIIVTGNGNSGGP